MGDTFSSPHAEVTAKVRAVGSFNATSSAPLLSTAQRERALHFAREGATAAAPLLDRAELAGRLSFGGEQPELGIATVEALCPSGGDDALSVEAFLAGVGRCVCPRNLDPAERLAMLVRLSVVYAHLKRNGGAAQAAETLGEARAKGAAAADSSSPLSAADVHLVFKMAYKLACVCRELTKAEASPFPPALFGGQRLMRFALAKAAAASGCATEECTLDLAELAQWSREHMPFLATALAAFVAATVLGERGSEELFALPRGMRATRLLDADDIFALGLTRLQLQGHGKREWRQLFDASQDGFSFENVQRAIVGYAGPTLMVLQTTTGAVLGAFSSSTWRDGAAFFGDSDAMLFALRPSLCVAGASSTTYAARNYMYLNSKFGHEETLPRGVGFGGDIGFGSEGAGSSSSSSSSSSGDGGGNSFRLWIDRESPVGCYARRDCQTFASADLVPGTGGVVKFELAGLEIWGCGGVEAEEASLEARQMDDRAREKMRTVDRAAFFKGMESTFLTKGFEHREQCRDDTFEPTGQ